MFGAFIGVLHGKQKPSPKVSPHRASSAGLTARVDPINGLPGRADDPPWRAAVRLAGSSERGYTTAVQQLFFRMYPAPGGQGEALMLRFVGRGIRLCDGLSRREVLRVGGLGIFGSGLSLADLSAIGAPEQPADRSFGRAKSCIVLFLFGGPPQHSTWDPKPDAPAVIRGDFGPIDTNVPGISICELLPRSAQVAD